MANIIDPPQEAIAEWDKWAKHRPKVIKDLAKRFKPWELYRMKSTGHRVTLLSFSEDGTMRVNITAQYNLLVFERQVFGIDPDDLEPCDLPGPDEHVGVMMSGEDVDENIDALRVAVRPDLFVMGEDGKAVRKQ